jgi:cytochrome c oxidase cbb3-type subunit 1
MLDASRPFMDSVQVTLPYLKARSVGGAMMGLGHVVFAAHFAWLLFGRAAPRNQPALLRTA